MVTQTNEIRDYRDLIVWQEAMEIAEMVYSLTRAFPREEAYGLVSQMRRSAVSIPSQFLRIAQGSLKELETQAQLAARIGMLDVEGLSDLLDRSERLGRRLVQFVRSLERGASQ